MYIARKNTLIFLLGALATAPAVCAETLTLDQAIAMAFENNRGLQSSALETKKAQERVASNRARQFPGINLYVLGAQQLTSFDYAGAGPLPDADVHLTTPRVPTGMVVGRVTQPLSSLIRIRRNLDTLKTGVALAEEQTRADRQKTAREVKRVYYSLQQVESSLRSVQQTAALYAEVEQLTSRWLVQEVALKTDLLEAQTRVAKTQQAEAQLLIQQATAKEQLNQLLGREVMTEFDVQPVIDVTTDDVCLEEARVTAMKNRPELRQAALRILQATQDLRAKKAEFIPDISAEFNNLNFINWGRYIPTQSVSVGVSLTWEPFDWGRKKHEAAERQYAVNQASLARRDAEGTALSDINDKYRQLRYHRAELRVARLSQDAALEGLRVVKNRYAARAVLVRDVLQAQVSLEQSNTDYQQALTSFWNARADYEHALGEDR